MASAPFDGFSLHGIYGIGWKQFGRDLWKGVNESNLFNGAAALAYYLTLSIFPAMIFLLGLLPYLPIPRLQETIIDFMNQLLPGDTAIMLKETVVGVVTQKHEGLLSIGALLTVWAASSGVYALIQQINTSYNVKDTRSYWRGRLTALFLLAVFGLLTVSALSLIVGGDFLQQWLANNFNWPTAFTVLYEMGRWIFVLTALAAAFSLTYYFGPDLKQDFRYITPGSVFGVVLLLAASLLFKVYVKEFGNYNATYGSIGAVIVLMLWLNILGVAILVGAEMNALIESYAKAKGKAPTVLPTAA